METLTPTNGLVEIREFLQAYECAPAPWNNPAEVIERLYSTLSERRDDEAFWRRLAELVHRLDEGRTVMPMPAGSRALRDDFLNRLLEDLRGELGLVKATPAVAGDCGATGKIRSWLKAGATMSALMTVAFLSAAGCGDCPMYDMGSSTNPLVCGDPVLSLADGADADVYRSLQVMVQSSTYLESSFCALIECIADMDSTYRAELLEMFEKMSDRELENALNKMLNDECAAYDFDDSYYGDDDDH